MPKYNGYTLEVVKVKGSINWAIKAIVDNLFWHPRYRGYYYKKEAVAGLEEWTHYRDAGDFQRDFNHNFHPAKELGIVEV